MPKGLKTLLIPAVMPFENHRQAHGGSHWEIYFF